MGQFLPSIQENQVIDGMTVSPGGFEFGIQGWNWGTPRIKSVTFFIDNTAMVSDQHGRPVRGIYDEKTNENYLFAMTPPHGDAQRANEPRAKYATHQQVVDILLSDLNIDLIKEINDAGEMCVACKGEGKRGDSQWCQMCNRTGKKQVIACAGWPQLPYEQLKKIKKLPPTPEDELERILDSKLREDALKMRAEKNGVK